MRAALLLALLLAGCATIHPATPGVEYASLEACQAENPETPDACQVPVPQPHPAVVITLTILVWAGWILMFIPH